MELPCLWWVGFGERAAFHMVTPRGMLAFWCALGGMGCSHTLVTRMPPPPPVATLGPGTSAVALLGVVDLRLRRGGGKTHERERFTPPTAPDPGYIQRDPTPLDPWNRYQAPPPRPVEEIRFRPTGELGTDEVGVPLADSFSERLDQALGDGRLRDAREDPLAQDPDVGRASAFLSYYPDYAAVVWLEVTQARADLPDTATLQNLLTLGACLSFGLVGLGFLIPVRLDTPVEFGVRAYLLTRAKPSEPIAASVTHKFSVEAKGSAGFDVDRFRADVAELLSRDAGIQLADQLAVHLGP